MIIRILGEGQLEVGVEYVAELNELDQGLADAVSAADQSAFEQHLSAMLQRVRAVGTPVPDDRLAVSDAILPAEGSPLEHVEALLGEQGLIPG